MYVNVISFLLNLSCNVFLADMDGMEWGVGQFYRDLTHSTAYEQWHYHYQGVHWPSIIIIR